MLIVLQFQAENANRVVTHYFGST